MTLAKLMKRAAYLPTVDAIDADRRELAMRFATFDVENLRRKIAALQLRIDNAQREANRFGEMAKEAKALAYDGKKLLDPTAATCATSIDKVAQAYSGNVKTWQKEMAKLRAAMAKAHNLIVTVDCDVQSGAPKANVKTAEKSDAK